MTLSCYLYDLAMGRESEALRYTVTDSHYLQFGDGKHFWYVFVKYPFPEASILLYCNSVLILAPCSSPGRFFLDVVTRMEEIFVSGIVFSVTETNCMR